MPLEPQEPLETAPPVVATTVVFLRSGLKNQR
jgi:hypothetical protein